MKAIVMAVALLALAASPVMAHTCVILIQQVDNEMTRQIKSDPKLRDDPKLQRAKALLTEAEKLHYGTAFGGFNHSESVAKGQEAGRILGLWK